MATSDEFKRELKTGDLTRALKLALSDAIELEITTWVVPTNAGGLGMEESKPGYRMRTRINLLDGDIETEVGPQFLANGPYTELRDFHIDQVRQGREIIQKNLQGIQRLFNMLVDVTYGDPTTPPPVLPEASRPPLPPAVDVPAGRVLEPTRRAEPVPESSPSSSGVAEYPSESPVGLNYLDPTADYSDPTLTPDGPAALGTPSPESGELANIPTIPDLTGQVPPGAGTEMPTAPSSAILEEPDMEEGSLGALETIPDPAPEASQEMLPDPLAEFFSPSSPKEATEADPFAEAGFPPEDPSPHPIDLTVPAVGLGIVGAIGAIATQPDASTDPSSGLNLPEPTPSEAEESLAALFTDDESSDTELADEGSFEAIEGGFAEFTAEPDFVLSEPPNLQIEDVPPATADTPEITSEITPEVISTPDIPLDDLFNEAPTGEPLNDLNPGDETALAAMFGEEPAQESSDLPEGDFSEGEASPTSGGHPAADIPAEDDAVLTALFTNVSLSDAGPDFPHEEVDDLTTPGEEIQEAEASPPLDTNDLTDLTGLFETDATANEEVSLFGEEEPIADPSAVEVEDIAPADLFLEESIAEEATIDFALPVEDFPLEEEGSPFEEETATSLFEAPADSPESSNTSDIIGTGDEESPSEEALVSLFGAPADLPDAPIVPDPLITSDDDLNALFEQDVSEETAFTNLETIDSFSAIDGLDLPAEMEETRTLPLPPPPPLPGESFPETALTDLLQTEEDATDEVTFPKFGDDGESEAVEDLFQAEPTPLATPSEDPLASLFGDTPPIEASELTADLPPLNPNLSMEESLASLFGEAAVDPTPFPQSNETPSELSEEELAALFDEPTEVKPFPEIPQLRFPAADLESDALLEESLFDDPFADFTLSEDLGDNPPSDPQGPSR